jgi:DNA topoisomerase III
MEHGQLEREAFMKEIISYTNDIVTKARKLADDAKNQSSPTSRSPAPPAVPALRQTDATYECRQPDCKFKAKKHIAGRLLTEAEARVVHPRASSARSPASSRSSTSRFDAALKLDEKFKVNFVFDNDDKDAAIELTEEQFIGEVAMPDGRKVKLYQSEKAYHLPELVTKKEPNGIRIGKSILHHDITTEQAVKLLTTGKTDVIKGFVSNRTKRKFDAHLTFDPKEGKIGFDFPPRPAKNT